MPDRRDCVSFAQRDVQTAQLVREAFETDGVEATEAAVGAARSMESGITEYGIPLTPFEVELLAANGRPASLPLDLIASFVRAHPDAFADLWVDADTITVAVLDRDSPWLAATRCVERDPYVSNVRFIMGGPTTKELDDLVFRIQSEAGDVERQRPDIDLTLLLADPTTGTVKVGVRTFTSEAESYLVDRFGPLVRVFESDDADMLETP